jgi:N-acetylmuramoyl-L-alanine amidase
VNSPYFPDSIAGVIYQPGAFASVKNGRFDQPVSESALRAARAALNNIDPSGGALYFYNPHRSADKTPRLRPAITNLGSFIFC